MMCKIKQTYTTDLAFFAIEGHSPVCLNYFE